jgi:hypothetical protein
MPFLGRRRGLARHHKPRHIKIVLAGEPSAHCALHTDRDDEKRIAAKLAKIMAMLCVRNTQLEMLHAGLPPITRTGDYSDGFVVVGRRIPWTEVSHIYDAEMRELMQEIVNRLRTFHLEADDPKLKANHRALDGRRDEMGRAGNRSEDDQLRPGVKPSAVLPVLAYCSSKIFQLIASTKQPTVR